MEAHTRPSKHLLELSMAEAEVMTMEWRGYLCLPLRITSIFGKSFIDLDSGEERLYQHQHREKHIKRSEPQKVNCGCGQCFVMVSSLFMLHWSQVTHVETSNDTNSVYILAARNPQSRRKLHVALDFFLSTRRLRRMHMDTSLSVASVRSEAALGIALYHMFLTMR